MHSDTTPMTFRRSRTEPRTLTTAELEAALTVAAGRRTIFDNGRLRELLAERDRRRRLGRRS